MKKALFILIVIVLVLFAAERLYVRAPITPSKTPLQVSYVCNGGKTIETTFNEGTTTPVVKAGQPPVPSGSATVRLSDGRTMQLARTLSADGVRYANSNESFVFWSKGNGALILENNKEKSYIGCVLVKPAAGDLKEVYHNGSLGLSMRYPAGYAIDESYQYQQFGPGKEISGVKFTVPQTLVQGTNLGQDTYISVESIPRATTCSATLFLPDHITASTVREGGAEYSFASSTGAAAGNRYEEQVYALPGTNPCIAVRYFIHYGVYENYPAGTVRRFDEKVLLETFDSIRRSVVVNQ